MPRYFLHIHNAHGKVEDEEGVDVSSLSAASEIAVTGIRDLLAAETKNGAINLNGRVDIANEAGKILVSIPFEKAVKVHGAG